MGFFRPTYAEIDLSALVENYNLARGSLPDGDGVVAMVKADAYGHGAIQVSKRLESQGVSGFGVATVEEGLELREAGIKSPIIVMGGLMGMGSPASGMMLGAALTPVVHSEDILDYLEAVSKAAGKAIDIHLKIDTGMTRLGILPASLPKLIHKLKECKYIKLKGIMTHFAEANDEDYTKFQLEIFKQAVGEVEAVFGPISVCHVANSTAILAKRFIETDSDSKTWIRPGLMLYGASPTGNSDELNALKPVMSLKSSVVLIKSVPKGTKVSYDCTFTTKRDSKLGIIPIGYADGYPWSLSNKGEVLVNSRRVPVVGRVTMDMIVVDLTDIDVSIGDEVVLMGKQGEEEITVDELAKLSGSISYEFFCRISKRMPRIYKN